MYLINLYVESSEYKKALTLIDELDEEYGSTNLRENLKVRIIAVDQIENKKTLSKTRNIDSENNPLHTINEKIELLISKSNFNQLLITSNNALDKYPAQAKFYYSKGLALSKLKKHNEAIEYLLIGIDYLIDDPILENNIYKELIIAYEAIGNEEKSKEYQKKLKKGS